jgi:hypothetical protein
VHHRAFLVGPHPAERGVLLEGVGQLLGFPGQLARVERLAFQTQRAGDRTDRNGIVT